MDRKRVRSCKINPALNGHGWKKIVRRRVISETLPVPREYSDSKRGSNATPWNPINFVFVPTKQRGRERVVFQTDHRVQMDRLN